MKKLIAAVVAGLGLLSLVACEGSEEGWIAGKIRLADGCPAGRFKVVAKGYYPLATGEDISGGYASPSTVGQASYTDKFCISVAPGEYYVYFINDLDNDGVLDANEVAVSSITTHQFPISVGNGQTVFVDFRY